jgi:predicted dehydrogenase
MKGKRIAIIGAGTILPIHAEAYQEIGQMIVGVADVDRRRAEQAAQKYGASIVTTDWRKLVERDDVDVIDICTPPNFHREIAVEALAVDKDVICEKPLARNLEESDQIMEAAENSAGRLLVCHQFRCLPFYRRLRWLIDEGHLGRIHFARVQRYDPPPKALVERGVWGSWDLTGGGVLITKAIHQLDMLLGLLGPARRVQALMGTFLCPIESEDHVSANIEFESGAIANISVSGQPYGGHCDQFDLFGSNAAVGQPWHYRKVDGTMDPQVVGELLRQIPEPGAAPTSGWKFFVRRLGWKIGRDFFPARHQNCHAPLFNAFFAAISQGNASPVTGADGRAAVEICTAIYQSALTGESVALPLDATSRYYRGINKDDYAAAVATC